MSHWRMRDPSKPSRNAWRNLAIINAVQGALAAELDIQGIYEAVGEKLREIFDFQTVTIFSADLKSDVIHMNYGFEKGQKYPPMDVPINLFYTHVLNLDSTFVRNGDFPEFSADFKDYKPSQGEIPKSLLVTPVIRKKESNLVVVIALMDIDSDKTFSDTDIRLVETVANAMSVALENARLFDETQRLLKETEERNAELAIINSVQAALAAELNIQGIYDAVGDRIRNIFDSKDVGIRIYDPKTQMEHFPYTYEEGKRVEIESEPVDDRGFSPHIYHTGESLLINENIIQEAEKVGSYALPGTAMPMSQVMVPMIAGDQVRGLIEIVDMHQEHAFTELDLRLLQTLANSMSVSLENARLFDETQRLLKETEERNAELAIITSVQQGLVSKLEIQAIYDLVGDKIRDVLDAQGVVISYYDRPTNYIRFPYYLFRGERIQEPDFELGKGLTSHIIHTGEALVINEEAAERFKELDAVFASSESEDLVKSWLGVPLIAGGQVKGVIHLENYEREHAYSASDVRLLSTLAGSMSVALENARTF